MNFLIVQSHPEATSYNAQLTGAAQRVLSASGNEVVISDLYAEDFDPVEAGRHYRHRIDASAFVPLAEQRHASDTHTLPQDVVTEIAKLEAADVVILQFPLWWHGPPAILKGWFDRVFVSGKIYRSRMRYDTGYFKGKRAVLSLTTGAPETAFGPGARGGDMNTMLWPIQYSLHYLGFSVLAPQCHFEVSGHGYGYSDEQEMKRQLQRNIDNWSSRLARIADEDPLNFPGWASWDEAGRSISGAKHGAC
ncbi:NAD(P)H-dependent oxidoreductase [Pararhizobium haloflavum]|uniref:NAD(P)H-dependent oxidoreductase n=1 Tax=Pararhizobium haloflavum TaxID=2037914 RepID=UPI000C19E47D|nr:NAD(P)H-dependent oxidoreductase [Pararhizobium haloflavum]